MNDKGREHSYKGTTKDPVPSPLIWKIIFNALGHPATVLDPQHKVIAVGGYAEDLFGTDYMNEPGAAFMLKPLDPSEALKKVGGVLVGRGKG